MSDYVPDIDRAPGIIKFDGTPNDSTLPAEPSRWHRFLQAIWPFTRRGGQWARHGAELGRAYAEAEVEFKKNTAARTAAEAAELTARADASRNEAARIFNSEIDSIFANNDIPDHARMLMLAKLFQANPDLAEQVTIVTSLLESLKDQHGTKVEFENPVEIDPADVDE